MTDAKLAEIERLTKERDEARAEVERLKEALKYCSLKCADYRDVSAGLGQDLRNCKAENERLREAERRRSGRVPDDSSEI